MRRKVRRGGGTRNCMRMVVSRNSVQSINIYQGTMAPVRWLLVLPAAWCSVLSSLLTFCNNGPSHLSLFQVLSVFACYLSSLTLKRSRQPCCELHHITLKLPVMSGWSKMDVASPHPSQHLPLRSGGDLVSCRDLLLLLKLNP